MSTDKRQAREALRSQVVDAEREFVKTIVETQGWNARNLTAKVPDTLSLEVAEKFRKAYGKELLMRAIKTAGRQRHALGSRHFGLMLSQIWRHPLRNVSERKPC